MLGRSNRLRRRSDIQQVYRRGQRARAGGLGVSSRANNQASCRVAVVVSTKVSKKAVVRNRLRRRLFGLAKGFLSRLNPPSDIVIVCQTDQSRLPVETLQQQLETCLSQLQLLG